MTLQSPAGQSEMLSCLLRAYWGFTFRTMEQTSQLYQSGINTNVTSLPNFGMNTSKYGGIGNTLNISQINFKSYSPSMSISQTNWSQITGGIPDFSKITGGIPDFSKITGSAPTISNTIIIK
jgi:hypothetical protein